MTESKSTTIRVVPACPEESQKAGLLNIAEDAPLLFSSDWKVLAGPTRFIWQSGREYGSSLNTAKAYADVLRTFLSAFAEEGWDWETAKGGRCECQGYRHRTDGGLPERRQRDGASAAPSRSGKRSRLKSEQ